MGRDRDGTRDMDMDMHMEANGAPGIGSDSGLLSAGSDSGLSANGDRGLPGPAAPQSEPLVVLEKVFKRFGKQQVLADVSLEFQPGLITGLLGPSGHGKTTLVNLIVGSMLATSGKVTVLGRPAPPRSVRQEIGFMPQSEALYNDLTARENLRFFGSLYGLGSRRLDEAIARVLETVQLKDQGRKVVASFSGGMKRRLSLAIALLHDPRLLVLDEPTVGLDPLHRVALWRSFKELSELGSTLIITTHVMDEAAGCDQIVMLHEGSVLAQGSPQQIIERSKSKTLEQAFLSFEKQAAKQAAAAPSAAPAEPPAQQPAHPPTHQPTAKKEGGSDA